MRGSSCVYTYGIAARANGSGYSRGDNGLTLVASCLVSKRSAMFAFSRKSTWNPMPAPPCICAGELNSPLLKQLVSFIACGLKQHRQNEDPP